MRAPLLLVLIGVLLATSGCSGSPGAASTVAGASPGPLSARADPSAPTRRAATGPALSGPAAATPGPAASPAPTPVVVEGDGRLTVVPGTSAASGPGAPTAYVVEVEGGLGVDARAFAEDVDRVLTDPRSWGADGRRSLRRVEGGDVASGDVAFRVALASPRTVDRLCAPLDTNGYFSCASDRRAVLNVERWLRGAPSYAGRIPEYRQYVVNHEVCHVLGHGHEQCPAPGAPAPVMVQQTKGLGGCAQNPWPFP